jgi:acyl-coenzyme A thioesterase PaaI-like protein
MKYKVKAKHHNSRMCFICGLKNPIGLRGAFYELENGQLVGIFKPSPEHQGYPNILHGGITSALLDETIGRAIMIREQKDYWGFTAEITVRYKKNIPTNQTLRVVGRITNDRGRLFEGEGKILLEDGTVAAEGSGKYLKVNLAQTGFSVENEEWMVTEYPDDPEEIEL